MRFFKILFGQCGRLVANRPLEVAGSTVFVTAISLISANAVFMQPGQHYSPMWETRPDTQFYQQIPGLDRSYRPTSSETTSSILATPHLIQGTSLKHVPVPKSRPAKSGQFVGQASLVRDLQGYLAEAGFYQGRVDGIFGDETKTAIAEFQSASGLIPDGEPSFGVLADIKTALAIAQSRQKALSQQTSTRLHDIGSTARNADVIREVQIGLKEAYGEDGMAIDGVMGKQTRAVIRKFQQRFHLETTGQLDQPTLKKLRETGIIGTT